jgi:hypothetical protein
MDRISLHPQIVAIIKTYSQQPNMCANKIMNLFDECRHRNATRTDDNHCFCHDCDKYIFMPK